MKRGEIWWASLGEPMGSGPGYKRPILIIQSDAFNQSRISTVLAAAITSNIALAMAPGNVLIKPRNSGLPKDSVVNVSQIITVDKRFLIERVKTLDQATIQKIDEGLKLVFSL